MALGKKPLTTAALPLYILGETKVFLIDLVLSGVLDSFETSK